MELLLDLFHLLIRHALSFCDSFCDSFVTVLLDERERQLKELKEIERER